MIAASNGLSSAFVFAVLIVGASGIVHTVKVRDQAVWTVGMGVYYPDMSITQGDTLKFMSSAHHDVTLVHAPSSGTHWDQCEETGIASGSTTTIFANSDFSSTTAPLIEKHYTPPTCGDFYIACSIPPHCMYGQRVKVTVVNADGSTCTEPCAGAACVTGDSKLARDASAMLHDVKPAPNAEYWGQAFYDDLTVNIGDTIVFKTVPGYHDVATLPTAAAFDSCDMSSKTLVADWTPMEMTPSSSCATSSTCCVDSSCGSSGEGMAAMATYTLTTTAAGNTYFVCSVNGGGHCREGQKFRLTVNPDAADVASGASRFVVHPLLVVFGIVFLA